MSTKNGPSHVIVDGSNLATEGRSLPSLKQLQEAVMGFMDEYPDAAITVVVDATFGHRIDKSESKEFEAGISNNELVAPPAGAVGRGDAFVLAIADKANAAVLSNDSFQEFHGEYEWLFDDGRLIGGKPVPHLGWVWVERNPVRGPISRKATGGRRVRGGGSARSRSKPDETVRTGSKEASSPMPVPKGPPPAKKAAAKRATAKKSADKLTDDENTSRTSSGRGGRRSAPKSQDPVNELMPFLEFVEHHPVGSTIEGTVDTYSSHGAYVTVGDTGVRAYIPLRLMAEPAPRSAKAIMKMGDDVSLVVVSFAAARRSIDCAVPDLAEAAIAAADREEPESDSDVDTDSAPPVVKRAAGKKRAVGKKAAANKKPAKKTPAKKVAAKTSVPVKKTAAKKSSSEATAGKKEAAKKSAPAKKAATKKAASKKTVAKKSAPAKKAAAKKSAPAKKAAAKKPAPAKKATTKKTAPAKKATAKKTTTKKKAASKKTVAKKDS